MPDCCRVALRLRELGLEAFVKTAGSLGLHVHVPLNTPPTYAQTKPFARELAARLAALDPDRITDRARAPRERRVFADWLVNDASRSLIAPYSLRAADHPTVSTPLQWDEVEAGTGLVFTAADIPRRLDAIGDPLAPALTLRQRLPRRVASAP